MEAAPHHGTFRISLINSNNAPLALRANNMESEVYVCNFIFSFVTHTNGQCQRFHAMAFLGHFSCIYLHFHAAFSCSPPDPDPPNRLASRSRNCARSPAASLTSHPLPMPSWPSAVATPRAGPQDADRVVGIARDERRATALAQVLHQIGHVVVAKRAMRQDHLVAVRNDGRSVRPPIDAPLVRARDTVQPSSARVRQREGDQRAPSVLRLGTSSLHAFPRVAALCALTFLRKATQTARGSGQLHTLHLRSAR